MKKLLILIMVAFLGTVSNLSYGMDFRGIVYDVGLQYNPGEYSVSEFDADEVAYDMQVIANTLHANAVRIEGEDLDRLTKAAELASECGLKVFFNPWLMGADEAAVVEYMREAAKKAEKLRKKGVNLVFVAGCEYSLFNKGIFDGKDINERIASMMKIAEDENSEGIVKQKNAELNRVLSDIVKAVRENYKGDITYSSGTWEDVDWNMFDIVGVDYYRDTQSKSDYIKGIKDYKKYKKPVYVMEVGCCAYEGASQLGGGGYTVCQGTDANGEGIYAGGKAPVRSEEEQADYIEEQIKILKDTGIKGMFVFLFKFPIMPHREKGFDADLTSYAIVKTFPQNDERSNAKPSWQPKEAFFTLAEIYGKLK